MLNLFRLIWDIITGREAERRRNIDRRLDMLRRY